MKTRLIILALTVVALLLAACGSSGSAQPAPSTSVQNVPSVVSASGKVLPAHWAALSFRSGGLVTAVNVQLGDQVKAGDVIAQLDDLDAQLAVSQAQAALATAQAQLAQLKASARPEQISVAEHTLRAAEADVWNASAQLAQLQAQPTAADIASAQAAVDAAFVDQEIMQDAYDPIAKIGGPREEQMRARLNAVKQAHAAALARLDQVKAGATQSELDAAKANISAAVARKNIAQAQLDLLKAGATAEEIAVAAASVQQAQAALETAQAHLIKTRLLAPFDGTIGSVVVRSGELIAAGQTIVTCGDLAQLRVETTDLSEVDVARVREGQRVNISFDALPNVSIHGQLTRLAPMSTPGQTGVNYIAIVELDQIDPALRWGMTAFVDMPVTE